MEIAGSEPDIMMITEVLPKAQVQALSAAIFNFAGYKVYMNFEPDNTNLGKQGLRSICVYIKDNIICQPLSSSVAQGVESLWLALKLKGRDMLQLGCLYRSPSSCLEASTTEICKMLDDHHNSSSHLLLAGDFNYPHINWETVSTTAHEDHPAHLFLNKLADLFLVQHVAKPTRYRAGAVPSLLDLVITTEEGMVSHIDYMPSLSKSDHLVLRFSVRCYTVPNVAQFSKKPALHRANFDLLRGEAAKIDWAKIQGMSVASAYKFFENTISRLVDQHVPKTRTGKTKNLYMNREALRLRKKKRLLWATYTRCPNLEDLAKYKLCRNKLRKLTRNLRRDFEAQIASDVQTNPKSFWRYVNTRLKTKPGIDVIEDEQGQPKSLPSDKSELLNKFFSSVFTTEDPKSLPVLERRPLPSGSLSDVSITSEEVYLKLLRLNISGAPGPDGLHPRILKELALHVALPLSQIFNACLQTSSIPDEWRHAVVVPIFKKGKKQSPSNYRPISLTSTVCKTMEAIMRDKILYHLTTNCLLSPHQHGFRPGRSCSTQLLEAMDTWTQKIEDKQPLDAVYLDFRKAFDSVPHVRLLLKLEAHGIEGKALSWVRAFLTDRTQQVLVEGTLSTKTSVTSGVPQGSVLGPLLFLLYVNDIPDHISSGIKLFADDCKVYQPVHSSLARDVLQVDLNELGNWSSLWQLPFNLDKCHVLHIGPGNPNETYTMMGRPLKATESERDLGVIVDGQLNFHQQTAAVVSKANKVLGIVRKSFANLDMKSLPLLFKSLIRPHLEFSNCIWGPSSRGDQKLVERVQRRATKMVPELRAKPYSVRLRLLDLPSLTYRRLRGDMVVIYQILHHTMDLQEGLLPLSETRVTRGHPFKLHKPQAVSRARRNFLSVRAVNSWNSLPYHVVSAPSVNAFKSRLDIHWKAIRYSSVFDD